MRKSQQKLEEKIQEQNNILHNREMVTISDAARRYSAVSKEIENKLNQLIVLLQKQKLNDESFLNTAFRIGRLQSLQKETNDIVYKATKSIITNIENDQSFSVARAQQNTKQLVFDFYNESQSINAAQTISIMTSWKILPKEALSDLVGFMSSGKPLHQMLIAISEGTAEAVSKALFNGLSLGKNPRLVAREAAQVTNLSLNRLMTITRTEMLRAYRESSRRAYVANEFKSTDNKNNKLHKGLSGNLVQEEQTTGFIKGWIWHCALDSRCCATCIAMHGTTHKPDEVLNGHPNCRCAMVPLTATWEELGFSNIQENKLNITSGEEWFKQQSENFKLNTLGTAKYHLYNGNRVALKDFVEIKNNPIWGSMRVEASAQNALQNANARRAMRN